MFSNKDIETFQRINQPTVPSNHYAWDILARIFHFSSDTTYSLANPELVALTAFICVVAYHILINIGSLTKFMNATSNMEDNQIEF